MVFAIIGENCSGKSTLANELKQRLHAELMTGKDYLRLAKSEAEAAALLREKLKNALTGSDAIYVISEKEQLGFLPAGAVRIYVQADIDTIKERFRARMHGSLPPPVEQMLERKHGMFDGGAYEYVYDGARGDAAAFCSQMLEDGIRTPQGE